VQQTEQGFQLSVRFSPHYHPYVRELLDRLIQDSMSGVQDAFTVVKRRPDGTVVTFPDGRPVPALYAELFTEQEFAPQEVVVRPYPVAELDFDQAGAYAGYNMELGFHVRVAVAVHLADNGRYDDALRWFHYVFDPTDDSDGPTPERFWKVPPFRTTDAMKERGLRSS
jgi:hypothetical protein